MTVKDLKALCKEKGISGYSKLRKQDLIDLLEDTGKSDKKKISKGEQKLRGLTISKLRDICEDMGISLKSKEKKQDIIDKILEQECDDSNMDANSDEPNEPNEPNEQDRSLSVSDEESGASSETPKKKTSKRKKFVEKKDKKKYERLDEELSEF